MNDEDGLEQVREHIRHAVRLLLVEISNLPIEGTYTTPLRLDELTKQIKSLMDIYHYHASWIVEKGAAK